MMKRAIVMAAVLALVACKKQDADAEARARAQKPTGGLQQGAQQLADQGKAVVAAVDQAALTAQEYEQLVLGLADCKLEESHIDETCPGLVALTTRVRGSANSLTDFAGAGAAIGQKLIGNPAPAVRLKSAQLMASILGTSGDSQDALVAAAAKETDLGVLRSMINTVANDGARNAKVGELLLASAAHADAKVRETALHALASPWNRTLAGGPEKLAELADKDPDPGVRESACEAAGRLGSASLIPMYEKHTASAAEPKMYTACMRGLEQMFYDYPLFENSSEAAYKLFLERLAATPRSEDAPPWIVMSRFSDFDGPPTEGFTTWRTNARWFKPEQLRKAMAAVIADKQSNWMARTGAIESMVGLGASKAELEALRKGYDPKAFDDQNVLEKIDDAVAKAK